MAEQKNILLNLLEILREHTDDTLVEGGVALTQKELLQYLEIEYGMRVDRKTVQRNLMVLREYGLIDSHTVTARKMRDTATGEMSNADMYSNFYYVRDFSDGELKLLSDIVRCFGYIPVTQAKDLMGKLYHLGGKTFRARQDAVLNGETRGEPAPELFYSIEALADAISRHRQVRFVYTSYGMDKKRHPTAESPLVVNPYQTAFYGGEYYLIGVPSGSVDVKRYRIDRIEGVEVLPSRRSASPTAEEVCTNVLSGCGECTTVKLLVNSDDIGEVVDTFGTEIRIYESSFVEKVYAVFDAGEEDVFSFVMQHGDIAVIEEPQHLRERVLTVVGKMNSEYTEKADA